MKTMSLTDARAHLPELVDQVNGREKNGVQIVRRGMPVARIVSEELYNSLIETLEILADEEFMEGFRKAVKDVEKGRTISVAESKRRLGL
jgi:prevent-host-death family protein